MNIRSAMLVVLLLLSSSLRAQQTSLWTPSKTYTDTAHGVTFQYPAAWHPARREDSMDGPTLMEVNDVTPLFAVDIRPGGMYRHTNLEAVYFVYAVNAVPTSAACDKLVQTLIDGDNPEALQPVTIHGLTFAVHYGGNASAGHSSFGKIYSTFHNANCYLFETNTAAVSDGLLDNARNLTKHDYNRIDAHLLAILQTVTISPPSTKPTTKPSITTLYHDPRTGVTFRYPSVWKPTGKDIPYLGIAMMPDNPNGGWEAPRASFTFSPVGNLYASTVLQGLVFTYAAKPEAGMESCLHAFSANESDQPPHTVRINGSSFEEFSINNDGMCHEQANLIDLAFRDGECLAFERDMDTQCYGAGDGARKLTAAEQRALQYHLDAIMQSVDLAKPEPAR